MGTVVNLNLYQLTNLRKMGDQTVGVTFDASPLQYYFIRTKREHVQQTGKLYPYTFALQYYFIRKKREHVLQTVRCKLIIHSYFI